MSNTSLVFLAEDKHTPVTSSELIADSLGKQHKDVLALVRKYKADLQAFGPASFKTKQVGRGSGARDQNKEIALLNEQQATFLVTLMRNSPEVVKFKRELVKAFFALREKVQTQKIQQLEHQRASVNGKLANLTRQNKELTAKAKKLAGEIATLRKVKPELSKEQQTQVSRWVHDAALRLSLATSEIFAGLYRTFDVPSYRLLRPEQLPSVQAYLEALEMPRPQSSQITHLLPVSQRVCDAIHELLRYTTDQGLATCSEINQLLISLTDAAPESQRMRDMEEYSDKLLDALYRYSGVLAGLDVALNAPESVKRRVRVPLLH